MEQSNFLEMLDKFKLPKKTEDKYDDTWICPVCGVVFSNEGLKYENGVTFFSKRVNNVLEVIPRCPYCFELMRKGKESELFENVYGW